MISAWVNGRTLGLALTATGTNNRFGSVSPNDRVPLDLRRDAYLLGTERIHGFPFVIDDNLLVTIHDFDLQTPMRFTAGEEIYALANLRFTRSALDSAVADFVDDSQENLTLQIERQASALDLSDLDQVFQFSKEVCAWGRGGRVWGNLMKHHAARDYAKAIADWLRAASVVAKPADAIRGGTQIKGLGVSFASKHLRLFDPARFATLDEVICLGLGYALNGAGYNLWLHDLNALKARHQLPHRIADLESGIFVLIRQIVRGTKVEEANTEASLEAIV